MTFSRKSPNINSSYFTEGENTKKSDWNDINWKKFLAPSKFEYIHALFAPNRKKWPQSEKEFLDMIYNPYFMVGSPLRQHQSYFEPNESFVDPIRGEPVLYRPRVAYFKHDSWDLFKELCYLVGIYDSLGTKYLPILTESSNPWKDRFIKHIRIVYPELIAQKFGIPERTMDRFPKQCQISTTLHQFVESEDRHLNPERFGYPPHIGHIDDLIRYWEPNFAFTLINNDPFIDILSRPVLTPKRVT